MNMVERYSDQNQSITGNENATSMSEEKAAEKIQASFRGYKTRKSLKDNGALPGKGDAIANNPIKEIEEKAKEKLSEHASEAAAKLNSAKQALEDELADIDLTDKDLEKAATKIQASYRNFTARKKQPETNSTEKQAEPEKNAVPEPTVNDKGEEENLDDIDLKDPQVEKAAVKIQSTFRGYKTRKEGKVDGKPLENGEKGEDED